MLPPDDYPLTSRRICKSKGVATNVAMNYLSDAKVGAIREILIEKGLTSKESYWKKVDEELERLTQVMEKMPPLPK